MEDASCGRFTIPGKAGILTAVTGLEGALGSVCVLLGIAILAIASRLTSRDVDFSCP